MGDGAINVGSNLITFGNIMDNAIESFNAYVVVMLVIVTLVVSTFSNVTMALMSNNDVASPIQLTHLIKSVVMMLMVAAVARTLEYYCREHPEVMRSNSYGHVDSL